MRSLTLALVFITNNRLMLLTCRGCQGRAGRAAEAADSFKRPRSFEAITLLFCEEVKAKATLAH